MTEVLIEEEPLQRRIAELGAEISADYEGRDLLLVGVLTTIPIGVQLLGSETEHRATGANRAKMAGSIRYFFRRKYGS